eukprot:10582375-Alexandrium_andersonii.AAC.1
MGSTAGAVTLRAEQHWHAPKGHPSMQQGQAGNHAGTIFAALAGVCVDRCRLSQPRGHGEKSQK